MTRSRASARKAGPWFERLIADYLALHVDDRVDRKVKTGVHDKGDIGGLRHLGLRLTVEVKNTALLDVGPWLGEAEVERSNDDGDVGIVMAKRHGKGHPQDQLVLLTLGDFVALLTGSRDHIEDR